MLEDLDCQQSLGQQVQLQFPQLFSFGNLWIVIKYEFLGKITALKIVSKVRRKKGKLAYRSKIVSFKNFSIIILDS